MHADHDGAESVFRLELSTTVSAAEAAVAG